MFLEVQTPNRLNNTKTALPLLAQVFHSVPSLYPLLPQPFPGFASAHLLSDKIPKKISSIIPLHEKFLQSDWLRAVVFQLNLKYLHVKITNLLRVVV